jgi:MFS family permease
MNLRTGRSVNVVFWTLCIMGGFAILGSTMAKSPVLNPFSASLGTPTEWSGFVSSASTIPGILISLPAASLSDIFGRRRFLLFAGFVFASAPFLYLFITVWWQLILVRFYHGFATAIFVPVAEASIAELFPTKRGERISLFTSATYAGRIVAPTLGGYILLVTNEGFHQLYLAVAVAGVTAFVMVFPFLAERRQQVVPRRKAGEVVTHLFSGWKTIARNRSVLIVCLIQASQYYAYGAFEFYLTGYLKFLHYSLLIPGFVATCVFGVAIFARPYMGRISDKVGRRVPIVLGCVVSAFPLFAIPHVTDFGVLILLAMIYGFGFATVTSSISPLISELVPEGFVGASMGFLAMTMDVGQTIGPIVSGFILASSLQYAGVFPSLALVVLFSCVVFALSGVARTRSTNDA